MRDRLGRRGAAAALCALCLNCGNAVAEDARSNGSPRADEVLSRVVNEAALAAQRGGADLSVNENNARATVQDNVARNLTTGNNTITENSFSNVTGIPMVVQNSGNNVVIQNSTILNLQMK